MTLDVQQVVRQLDTLETEIQRLRELIHPLETPTTAQETDHPYVERVPNILSGEPVIKGSRTPIRAIVEHWKFGASPEEIVRKLPHLRLAQVFDALSYYDDHRDEIEGYIVLNRVPVDDRES